MTGQISSPLEKAVRSHSFLAGLLATLLIGGLLYVFHSAFIPVALALLFALLLSSPVEALHKTGLPRSVSAVVIAVVFLAPVAGAVNLLWNPALHWIEVAPQTVRSIERKLSPVTAMVQKIETLTNRAEQLVNASAPPAAGPRSGPPTSVRVAEAPGLLVETRTLMVSLVAVVVLTLFLLAGGPPMLARMTTALASSQQATHVLTIIRAVRIEVARYYGTLALINLGLGVATTLMTFAFGMPNPILWGVVAGLLNFLPYIGSATTLIVLSLVASLTFEGLGPVLGVAASYLTLATIEGQLIQPLFVGRRLELNPPIVFLTLWFAGWFWGIAGIIVAIPSLVALKVIAEHHRHGAALVAFLSRGQTKDELKGENAPLRSEAVVHGTPLPPGRSALRTRKRTSRFAEAFDTKKAT